MSEQLIKTPVEYESRSKTIYQCGGYGIVAKVDEFTHDADEGIGQPEYDELCDQVGQQIVEALNSHANLVAIADAAARSMATFAGACGEHDFTCNCHQKAMDDLEQKLSARGEE